MKLYFETPVNGSVKSVFAGFNRKLFEVLSPGPMKKGIKRFDGCTTGDHFLIQTPFGEWFGIISSHQVSETESFFVDEGVRLPFPLIYWRHRHIVRASNRGTLIVDDIEYRAKSAWLEWMLRPALWCFFKARYPLYQRYFREF